jgi:quercetin dioxygenase-like cupin family protein
MLYIDLHTLPYSPVSHDPEIKKQVILRHNQLPGLRSLSRARLLPGQVASPHMHPDSYEVFIINQGEGTIRIDEDLQPLRPGVCVVVEPGEEHEIRATGESPLVILTFGLRLAANWIPGAPLGRQA